MLAGLSFQKTVDTTATFAERDCEVPVASPPAALPDLDFC